MPEKSEVQSTQKKRIQNVNHRNSFAVCSLHHLEEGDYIAFEEERDNFNKEVISHNVIFFKQRQIVFQNKK